MTIKIRSGIKDDLPQVLNLIKKLAEYENSINEVDISIKQLEKDGFKDCPDFYFLVAEHDKKIVGISFYFIRYSTWKGKVLFLEDFIIKSDFRRKGIGELLFKETIKIAHKEKLNGFFWQVLDWNIPAINFYKKLGAEISSNWLNGRLNKQQINNFV